MDVSIVIPTKNGGHLFEKVLDAVFKQKTEYEYEVICVDSGSKDGTLDVIRKYPCRLFQIEPSEFGHGKTRNYGASKGNGTYIIFITQDALPATDTWLQNFIDAMKMDPEIVGGFGIHFRIRTAICLTSVIWTAILKDLEKLIRFSTLMIRNATKEKKDIVIIWRFSPTITPVSEEIFLKNIRMRMSTLPRIRSGRER